MYLIINLITLLIIFNYIKELIYEQKLIYYLLIYGLKYTIKNIQSILKFSQVQVVHLDVNVKMFFFTNLGSSES